jgi:tetratricopeptide (TPR) repeat protein
MNRRESVPPAREAELRARIATGSRDVSDYMELANLLRAASRFEEAADIFQHGLQRDFSNGDKARLAWELGDLFDKVMNRSAEAVTLAASAVNLLDQERESPDTLLLRGRSYALLAHAVWFQDSEAGADAASRAIELLEPIVTEHSDLQDIGVALGDLAWAHTTLGDLARAIELCQEYLRRELDLRHRLVALMVLAEALRLAERLPEAKDATTQALEYSAFDPLTRPVLYNTLGLILRAMNRPSDAETAFEQALDALRMDPFRSGNRELLRTIYGNLAEVHYEMGKLDAAIRRFEQLLTQYPDTPYRILNCLADCHAANGSYDEARRFYEQVLSSPMADDEERVYAKDGLAVLRRSKPD